MDNTNTREKGIIKDVFVGKEDHGIYTCSIGVDFEGGGHQGFGGLMLKEGSTGKSFIENLCKLFGVKNIKDIQGKNCYALRCWDSLNDRIEGLESIDTGKRFIISKWRKSIFPNSQSPLEEKRNSLISDIEFAKEKIRRTELQLKSLEKNYTDWEKE